MSSLILIIWPLMAPFSIIKALLPHLSSFLPITSTFLAAFSIEKAFLPHMSSFLLITCLSLTQFCTKKLCFDIWALFCLLTSFCIKKHCCQIWAFVLIACSFLVPLSIWKNLLFELYNLFFLLNTCPSLIPFPAKKGFICRILSQKTRTWALFC